MSLKERTINVDIMTKEYTKLKYKQGESGQNINIKLFKNGKQIDLIGLTVNAFFEKTNGEILEKSATINDNVATITLSKQILNIAGKIKTELFITKGEELVISFTIIIDVEESINASSAVEEQEEWDSIKDLLIKSNNLAMIDDNNVSNKTTSSSYRINSQLEDIKNDFNSQIKDNLNYLESKKMNKNSIITMANMGQDVKEAMTGGSVAVVGVNSIQNKNIINNQIDVTKVNFITENENKFNAEDIILNSYISNTDGSLILYEGYISTNFIDISDRITKYRFLWYNNGFWSDVTNLYFAFYDSNYNFISGYSNKTLFEVDVPENANYVRLSALNNRFDGKYNMLVTDELYQTFKSDTMGYSTPSVYYPYSYKIEKLVLDSNQIDARIELNEKENEKFKITKDASNTIRSICRMGYDINTKGTPPAESIDSFILARIKGFDTLRCNLRYTKDGIPVCFHDENINNNNARFKDGSNITNPVLLSSMNLTEINNTYDFGLQKGDTKGYELLKLDDMLKTSKYLGSDVYIELKDTPTQEQIVELVTMIKKNGMIKNTSIVGDPKHHTIIKYMLENTTNVSRVGMMYDYVDDNVVNKLNQLKIGDVEVFVYGWTTMPIDTNINNLIENDIPFEVGTFSTEEEVEEYIISNPYCSGFETFKFPASKTIFNKSITNF